MTPSEATSIIMSPLAREAAASQGPDGALAVLHRLVDHGPMGGFLRAFRDDPAAARRASKSYRHPLGFDSIMLIDEQPAFRLRLHAWWPQAVPGAEHIHNHRFVLATAILLGRYDMTIYQPGTAGIEVDEYRERYTTDMETWHLEQVGVANLRVTTSTSIGEGSGYALEAAALHRVEVPQDRMCVTLFLTTSAIRNKPEYTKVFALPGSTAPAQSRKHSLSLDSYRERLSAIAAELAPT